MTLAAVQNEQDEQQHDDTRLGKLKSQDIPALLETCKKAISDIDQHTNERSQANAEIKAIRERLETYGIGKKALALAIQVSKMDERQIDGFWLALQVLLKAIDKPISINEIQMDLFAE